ncbi:hypothetical protein Moror_7878 [Moniliophthora roreri MCA 2997]|uniref:Uncharacterized protein n=1 Tax=Moniliophthora roreri (strain MCA 2997) TaxID=1381753 RepID=V2XB77_MONRO|nr:hypothetical protein Moror_7878 [Moniliophthora roreri MCA 2997]
MEIANANNITISGGNINAVHRDQYNQTIINGQVVQVGGPAETVGNEDDEYNQYHVIIHGDVYIIERVSTEHTWDEQDRSISPQRAIHKVQLYGDNKVFTTISYYGRNAAKVVWKKDFLRYSHAKCISDPETLFQLFGINRSKVPMLIFYDGM